MTKYRDSVKYTKWVELFTSKDSKTYGNATQSALAVYDTESYSTASVIGHENLRKHKELAKLFLEREGYTYNKLMALGIEKVSKGKYQDWESFMKTIGYFPEKPEQPTAVTFDFATIGEVIAKERAKRGLK